MIVYNNKTVSNIYEELNSQIRVFRLGNNFDYETFLLYLNRSIKEIYSLFMAYEDWNTTDTLVVSNNALLPREFVDMVKVMVSRNGSPTFIEATYIAPVEYTNLTNWYSRQRWNAGSNFNPVYTLWSEANALGASQLRIKIYPNTEYLSGAAPTGFFYPTQNFSGKATYLAMPSDLSSLHDIIPVPYLYHDLLLLSVFLKVCTKVADAQVFVGVYQTMVKERTEVMAKRIEREKISKRKLDDFLEPVYPSVPKKTQPKELEHLQ